jgi:hypothetical protein
MSVTTRIRFRRSRTWFGRFRRLRVLVDDREVCTLGHGEEAVVEVSAGEHRVQTKMDWCSSNALMLVCESGQEPSVFCDAAPLPTLKCFVAPSRVFVIELVTGSSRTSRPIPGPR